MSEIKLSATTRTVGQGSLKVMRDEGCVPAILYGQDREPTPLQLEARDIERVLSRGGGTVIASLKIKGERKARYVMLKEVQTHPVRRILMHVDFHEISMTDTIHATVPVVLVGEERVAESGGILQHLLREVTVECLPGSIPERLELDVSGLTIGDTLTVAGLDAPEGITMVTDSGEAVATVTAPRALEEITPAEEEEEGLEEEDGEADAEETVEPGTEDTEDS